MAPRSKDIYRGKHRWRFPVTLVVSILLVLIVLAVVLFYSLQKYAVYGKDGVTLEIPGLTVPASQTARPDSPGNSPVPSTIVNAELVVVEPDYSGIDLQPGDDLDALHAAYLTAADITAGLDAALLRAEELETDALVLEMKAVDGTLTWTSDSEMANAYGVNGQTNLAALVNQLKEAGYYTVAELRCCVDTLMATRNPPVALKNAGGGPYEDASGGWLDPYSLSVRQYLLSLMEELAEAGFDEILLSELSFPSNQAVVSYSQELVGASTPRAAVSGLAVYLAQNAPEDVRVSALLQTDALRGTGSEETESVQDAALFTRLFDRLYLRTDAANLAADANALYAAAGTDMDNRFVPILPTAPDTASWTVG